MSLRLARNGAGPADPGAARSRLEDVYARPPLDRLDRPGAQSSPSNPLSWLGERLTDLLNGAHRVLGTSGGVVVGSMVLALVLAIALWRLSAESARRPRRAPTDDAGHPGSDPDAEWAAADEAAARGDFREAVRRAFRSALLTIATAGRLPVDAAWTTRELLAHAAGDADVLAALAAAAAAFDLAWYSGRAVTLTDWHAQRLSCAALRRLARRASPAGPVGATRGEGARMPP